MMSLYFVERSHSKSMNSDGSLAIQTDCPVTLFRIEAAIGSHVMQSTVHEVEVNMNGLKDATKQLIEWYESLRSECQKRAFQEALAVVPIYKFSCI